MSFRNGCLHRVFFWVIVLIYPAVTFSGVYQAEDVDGKLISAREVDFKNRLAVWELELKRLGKSGLNSNGNRGPASEPDTISTETQNAEDILKQLDSRLTWDPRLVSIAVEFYKKCSGSNELSNQIKNMCRNKLESLKKSKLYSSLGLRN